MSPSATCCGCSSPRRRVAAALSAGDPAGARPAVARTRRERHARRGGRGLPVGPAAAPRLEPPMGRVAARCADRSAVLQIGRSINAGKRSEQLRPRRGHVPVVSRRMPSCLDSVFQACQTSTCQTRAACRRWYQRGRPVYIHSNAVAGVRRHVSWTPIVLARPFPCRTHARLCRWREPVRRSSAVSTHPLARASPCSQTSRVRR